MGLGLAEAFAPAILHFLRDVFKSFACISVPIGVVGEIRACQTAGCTMRGPPAEQLRAAKADGNIGVMVAPLSRCISIADPR